MISFDRKGKCPICKKQFKSEACPHSYWYVENIIEEVNSKKNKKFKKDVSKLSRYK